MAKTLRAGLLRGTHIPKLETEGHNQLFRYLKRLWADLDRVKTPQRLATSERERTPPKYENPPARQHLAPCPFLTFSNHSKKQTIKPVCLRQVKDSLNKGNARK
jgi:hypothetical protein